MQHQRQDLDHLPVTTWPFQQRRLEAFEALRQFGKRRAIAQCTGLTLEYGEIVAPVVDRSADVMPTVDDSRVLGNHVAFCGHHKMIGIDAQADRPVGEGGRDAVTVALEVDQAGR